MLERRDQISEVFREIVREELDSKFREFAGQLQGRIAAQESVTNEALLSQDEAAAYFAVTKATIIRWQTSGLIKVHHKGKRAYYLKSELLDSLRGRRSKK